MQDAIRNASRRTNRARISEMTGACPKCRSSDYSQYDREQGKNRCDACGYVATVRDFHTPSAGDLRFVRMVAKDIASLPVRVQRPPERKHYQEIKDDDPAPRLWYIDRD